ncbi:rhomboid-like protein [Mycobacterium intracellulare]|uniref:rhomboid-like protein n=1 Tax=Mycobacterium intracellulare TaxID=1767 RepID=UPI003003010C
MIGGIVSRLARVQFTVGYAALLLAISCAILVLGPDAHDVIVARASTNLHNLAHGHLGTLLGSALVVDAGPLYFWLPFLTCLLALAELHLRTIRLVVAFLVGHIGATLLVAAALAGAVEFGWLPVSITRASDVGNPVALAGRLGRLVGGGGHRFGDRRRRLHRRRPHRRGDPGRARVGAVPAADPLLGVLVSARFRQPIHWTPARYLMLAASSGFGFLMLAHHWGTMAATPVFGLLGAVVAYAGARYVTGRGLPVAPLDGDDTLPGPAPAVAG